MCKTQGTHHSYILFILQVSPVLDSKWLTSRESSFKLSQPHYHSDQYINMVTPLAYGARTVVDKTYTKRPWSSRSASDLRCGATSCPSRVFRADSGPCATLGEDGEAGLMVAACVVEPIATDDARVPRVSLRLRRRSSTKGSGDAGCGDDAGGEAGRLSGIVITCSPSHCARGPS